MASTTARASNTLNERGSDGGSAMNNQQSQANMNAEAMPSAASSQNETLYLVVLAVRLGACFVAALAAAAFFLSRISFNLAIDVSVCAAMLAVLATSINTCVVESITLRRMALRRRAIQQKSIKGAA
jgi:hypothetical protein